jgi:hypothetical protein
VDARKVAPWISAVWVTWRPVTSRASLSFSFFPSSFSMVAFASTTAFCVVFDETSLPVSMALRTWARAVFCCPMSTSRVDRAPTPGPRLSTPSYIEVEGSE